jgi:hypothetical protein
MISLSGFDGSHCYKPSICRESANLDWGEKKEFPRGVAGFGWTAKTIS